jgi:hypothetical protein
LGYLHNLIVAISGAEDWPLTLPSRLEAGKGSPEEYDSFEDIKIATNFTCEEIIGFD